MARPALHVALVFCVLLAGCSVPLLGPDHTREPRAVAALDNATDAVDAVDTYRYTADLRVVATSEDRTETVTVDLNGSVNSSARRLRTTATRDGETRRSYLLNRTAYRECAQPWDGWGVEELEAEGNWSRHSPVDRQLSLLESGSLYWNGTDTVDGERALLVTGHPTSRALTQYQERRSGSLLGGPSVENARFEVWLDPNTSRPVRSELHFDVSGRGGSADAGLTTHFGDYGDPVTVELPVDARTDQYELGCPGE